MSTNEEDARGSNCIRCGKPFTGRNFNKKSENPHYSYISYIPICKECLNKLFMLYKDEYGSDQKAVKRICMAYNIYYSDVIYQMCVDTQGNASIATYIAKSNLPAFRKKTFDNSIEEGFYFTGESKSIGETSSDISNAKIQADPKLVLKWGNDFSVDDYEVLENHYKMLKHNNPNATNNQEIFITSLCHLNMMMTKALKDKDLDSYTKANEQYSKVFTKAGLKAVQEVDMGSDDCWGEWVRRIEEYTPAEYYKNKSLFKDFDNVGDYFKRFVLRPLRNLMHGTTDRDYEYCVKDGDENEYSEPD